LVETFVSIGLTYINWQSKATRRGGLVTCFCH